LYSERIIKLSKEYGHGNHVIWDECKIAIGIRHGTIIINSPAIYSAK